MIRLVFQNFASERRGRERGREREREKESGGNEGGGRKGRGMKAEERESF